MVHAVGPFFKGWGIGMAKKDIKDFVCKPYCSFYREGVKEELICSGARIVAIFLERGVLSPLSLSWIEHNSSLSSEEYALLQEIVCRPCPFLADGCDFRSAAPPVDAEPCGGYILLSLLAGEKPGFMNRLKEIEGEQKKMAGLIPEA
jgi:hypothetical protein